MISIFNLFEIGTSDEMWGRLNDASEKYRDKASNRGESYIKSKYFTRKADRADELGNSIMNRQNLEVQTDPIMKQVIKGAIEDNMKKSYSLRNYKSNK